MTLFGRNWKNYQNVSVFIGLILAASANAADDCAYNVSKEILTIVKDSVGLRSHGQIEAMAGLVKIKCKVSDEAAQAGMSRAVKEMFPELATQAPPNGTSVNLDAFPRANLLSTLRSYFSDPELSITDASKITVRVTALTGMYQTVTVSGPITLSNGYGCTASSETQHLEAASALSGTCKVEFTCRIPGHFRQYSLTKDCRSF